MDENITIIFDRPPQGRKFSTNGPEWTRDDRGHLVVYTRADAAGIMQQWAARLVDGMSLVTQLTRNTFDCYGNMPSRFQDGKPPRVAYTYLQRDHHTTKRTGHRCRAGRTRFAFRPAAGGWNVVVAAAGRRHIR